MDKELTIQEQVYYSNYNLIDECDLCGKPFPITNRNDGNEYLEFVGTQLLCPKCRSWLYLYGMITVPILQPSLMFYKIPVSVALIPIMTSNTTPSGIATSIGGIFPPYYAFDGNSSTYWSGPGTPKGRDNG